MARRLPPRLARLRPLLPGAAAWAIGLGVAVAAYWMAERRFETCSNANFDLAFYMRIVWGLAYGDRFNPLVGAHDLGLHLAPVLHLFAPLAFFLPLAKTLLAAQAAVLGACAPLLYRIAAKRTGSAAVGVALAAAWALYPTVLQVGSREFHPGTLALLPLLAAFDALDEGRWWRGALLLVLATLCREDVALVAAGAGVVAFLRGGRWRIAGGTIAAAALLWFSVYVVVVQPAFLPPRGSIDEHFRGMGHSAPQVIGYALAHPLRVLGLVCTWGKAWYLLALLLPLCLLPLAAPAWLIPAAGPLAINLLSGFWDATRVESHYATLLLPPLFFAAACGARALVVRLRARLPGNARAAAALAAGLAAALPAASLWAHYQAGALPGSRTFDGKALRLDRDKGIMCWYARETQGDRRLSVVAPYGALAHLADRRRVYSADFPHPLPDVAILDVGQRKWVTLGLGRWNKPWELEYERIAGDRRYGLVRGNAPYLLMRRGAPGGEARVGRLGVKAPPPEARGQGASWGDKVRLEAAEGGLRIESEKWGGGFEQRIVVKLAFYWRALSRLPDGLFVKCVLTGRGKSLEYFFRPTGGLRTTSTWRKDELVRDEQVLVSPGGWPLREVTAEVLFVDVTGKAWPPGAAPHTILWPPLEADRDK